MRKKTNNNFTWVQGAWACAGIVLLVAGIYIMNVPDNKLIYVADHLGFAMLFSGFINLFIYVKKNKEIHGSHWLLADGMSTSLLSIFPLFNNMIIPVVIPFFFGIWELFSGILKFIESRELEEEGIHGWHGFMIIGMLELASGVASLLKPIEDFVGMNHVIAIILFVQSCGFLFKILIYHSLLEKHKNKLL